MAYRSARPNKIRDAEDRQYCARNPLCHGGHYFRKSWGRKRRHIAGAGSMNLTLRSSQARGQWSFRNERNRHLIKLITKKFSARFKVTVIRVSNVGNHLHFHVMFPNKKVYLKFIRAITAAIAIAITGCSRWTKGLPTPFWDERPFTRPIANAHEFAVYENYLDLNDLEGEGFARASARWLLKIRKWARGGGKDPPPARFA